MVNKDIKFENAAAEFIYVRSYARWIDELSRRETWDETVDRYIDYIEQHCGDRVPQKVFRKARHYMANFGVMPSMRAVWAAGKAADATNVACYNCAFRNIDCIEAFAECLYILMCGTGFGFSIEDKYINQLPNIPKLNGHTSGTFIIPDSKEGWADSIKHLMQSLYSGEDLELDYSLLRSKGARLNTMGGRSSGPMPLASLHDFIRKTFEDSQGTQLESLQCLDILNKIAEIVVVGGVRRSSQISLSDLSDNDVAKAKIWPFPMHRAMSNNSAVYYKKPDAITFLEEWAILAKSGTGERGIFNLEGARDRSPERRKADKICGTNPCGEIALRSAEFCNLSEVVIKSGDDLDDILDKIETAAWLGAIQSTFTNFPYIGRRWKSNCQVERLLGVSLTGQMDNIKILTKDALTAMKKKAIKIAHKAAKKLEINMPAAVTCVKPSGTVSQLVHSSSGLHARFDTHYLRRYRVSAIDPLYRLLKAQGFKLTPENGQGPDDWKRAVDGDGSACTIYEKGKRWTEDKVTTWIVSFPIKSPKGCVTKDSVTAIDQLEHYKKLQKYWCEHNASCTVYVKNSEWFKVGNWVYENWEYITGVSFLPYDGGKYEQAPYESITKEEYERLEKEIPKIDYSELSKFENEDMTEGKSEMACIGEKCDI